MADPGFEIEVGGDEASAATVGVAGEIDLATAPRLAETLERIESETPDAQVHVDMHAVTFLDSSGISVLVHAHKRLAEAGGCLVLHRPSDQIRRVLEISGLGSFFELSEEPAT